MRLAPFRAYDGSTYRITGGREGLVTLGHRRLPPEGGRLTSADESAMNLVLSEACSPKYLEKLSEESLRHLRPSLANSRTGTIRLPFSPVYRSNSQSERCSNPFSDSLRREILGRWYPQLCIETPKGSARGYLRHRLS